MSKGKVWSRLRSGTKAAAITGHVVARAMHPPAPLPPRLDVVRSGEAAACQQVQAAPQLRSTEELVKEAANWQKVREADLRNSSLNRDLREPVRGEVRKR
jgi:hypothetical protein